MSAFATTKQRSETLPRESNSLRQLALDEVGAAYTLSYVMVIPFYALFICVIIESALMLTAKLGTVYSAYGAARTASVWASATTWEKTKLKAEESAFRTMTPFASGTNLSVRDANTASNAGEALAYGRAYAFYGNGQVAPKYLLAKYSYARQHVKVVFEGPPETWNSEIKVKVTYDFPFYVPGVGRLFGTYNPVDRKYYYQLTSQVTLPNEGPKDGLPNIGIGYGTLE